jgi:hypothetical protein
MSGYALPLSDEIAELWIKEAVRYAEVKGYSFDPDCLSDLTGFLQNAAMQLRSSDEAADGTRYLLGVMQLVQCMIDELDAQSPGEKVLHEWTLPSARLKLCPLFPFC